MSDGLIATALLLAIGWFWLSSLRARELANEIGKTLCKRRGYQFLDETVAMSRITLTRTDEGIRIKRIYSFDYAKSGYQRERGWLMLTGINLTAWSIEELEQEGQPIETEIKADKPPD